MPEFWRSWYLIHRLHCTHIRQSGAVQQVLFVGEGMRFFVMKQPFLEQSSEKRLWILKRSMKSRNERMQKDNAILEKLTAQIPQKIDERSADAIGIATVEKGIPPASLWIRTTGHGEEFANFTNALTEFFNKYKILWVVCVALILFIASWSPTAEMFLAEHIFSNHNPAQETFMSAGVATTTPITATQSNVAIGNSGPVSQNLTINPEPKPIFQVVLDSTTTLQSDNLYHAEYEIDVGVMVGVNRPTLDSYTVPAGLDCATATPWGSGYAFMGVMAGRWQYSWKLDCTSKVPVSVYTSQPFGVTITP